MSFRRPEKDVFSPFTFQPNFDVVWTSGIVVFSTSFQRVFAGWDLFGFETLIFATSGILSMYNQLVTLQRDVFNVFFYLVVISSKTVAEVSCSFCIYARLVSFFLFFLFLSMVQFVNSRCSSLMLNHHSITKLIISLKG